MKTPSFLFDKLSRGEFAQLKSSPADEYYASRYAYPEKWIRHSWDDAVTLGLHLSAPISILDLGTGPGYFPYACQGLGHHCVGLDLPNGSTYCREIRSLLGLKAFVEYEIVPGKHFPDIGRFDLVTAFHAHFHAPNEAVWTFEEWTFFLDDLRNHVLNSNGRLAMQLNRLAHRQQAQDDAALVSFLMTRGAIRLGKRMILFDWSSATPTG